MKGLNVYVDVGGTLTRLIVRDISHRELKNISFVASPQTLKTQIQTALEPYPKPQHLIVGIRGVWTHPEKNYWKIKFKYMAKSVTVMSDVELAHRLVFKNSAGILLNAGTGSIAFGRSPGGIVARAGGLGPLLGDEGSGFWLGRQYLKKIYAQKHDLRLVRKFAKHPTPIPKIASLSKQIIGQAFTGNKELKRMVQEGQKNLERLLLDVATQLKWQGRIPVKLVGGLFKNSAFKKSFIKKLPPKKFHIV